MKVIDPWSRCPASVTSATGCPRRSARHDRFVDVDVGPRTVEVGDDRHRAARRQHLAGVNQLRGHDAGDRRLKHGIGDVFLQRGDLGVRRRRLARAHRRFLRCGRPARSRATASAAAVRGRARRRTRAAATRAASAASSRCLREPAFDCSKASNAGDRLKRPAVPLCGLHVGLRGLGLRLRLADVLRAGPGLQQFQRGDRLIAVGFGPQERSPRRPYRAAR